MDCTELLLSECCVPYCWETARTQQGGVGAEQWSLGSALPACGNVPRL